ncbi:zinc finger protein SHOOT GRAVITROPISM 5-like [Andrographis paniculata]|uniref:zinc finger protein SHOOT GRAVITROPISM 5-like n=1 Tax=Andrographis paniculata TaxID=175694 RepID=UPI0021E8E4AA|nr:zinc finger protein SHOOT GRAVITROPISM 5-like [Andrographis paniculata]
MLNAAAIDPSPSSEAPPPPFETIAAAGKRKRRPAGTPDPDAEVVSLSPKTLLESDRYVCEICNQGFQRDQNLQMHRRRHKVPWKLLKRDAPPARKRVFVCPEASCLHHDPCHALGDLVGIKKHFRRKHSNRRQWVCGKCSKGYAVQSDYKAHLKTCGTRGHSCDCGRVFSRVESFIEHQDACDMGRLRSECRRPQAAAPPPLAASSTSQSSDTNLSVVAPWITSSARAPWAPKLIGAAAENGGGGGGRNGCSNTISEPPDLELQLLTKATSGGGGVESTTQLQLSIGSSEAGENVNAVSSSGGGDAAEQVRVAVAEKAHAEESRQRARWQIEVAEREFAHAKRIRREAQAELQKAEVMKEQAARQMNATVLQLTCHSCKHKLRDLLQI